MTRRPVRVTVHAVAALIPDYTPENLTDDITDLVAPIDGLHIQTIGVHDMDAADVIPGSPLATDLAP